MRRNEFRLKRHVWIVIGVYLLCKSAAIQETALAQDNADLKSRYVPQKSLAQTPPEVYRLAAGDIVGVYVEGIFGKTNSTLTAGEQPDAINVNRPTAIGNPFAVDSDGKITLPKIEPIRVVGMTLIEFQKAVQKSYEGVQPKGKNRVLITLMRPRQFQVQVIRQEVIRDDGKVTRRGTAHYIDLPAYQNDVYQALVRTGGMPDFEQFNISVYRKANAPESMQTPIPTKLQGRRLPFQPNDVILQSGDIVFVEAIDAVK